MNARPQAAPRFMVALGGPLPFECWGRGVWCVKLALFGHGIYSHCQVLENLGHEQLSQQEWRMTGKPWESPAPQ